MARWRNELEDIPTSNFEVELKGFMTEPELRKINDLHFNPAINITGTFGNFTVDSHSSRIEAFYTQVISRIEQEWGHI